MIDKNSITEDTVNIFSIDDAKLKILANIISNKSSIAILNLLFHSEMTANEIAQKTNMSLQLVKHYLDKMQQIDLIRISKTEKNSKARNMNYYKTSKLAIIITPSKIAEKTRQSKSLIRSFNSISRFFGIGIASAICALSLLVMSVESRLLNPIKSWYLGFDLPIEISGTGVIGSVDESLYMAKTRVDSVVSNPGAGSGTPYFDPYVGVSSLTGTDTIIALLIFAGIGAVITFVVFNSLIRKLQKNIETPITQNTISNLQKTS